ncbi:MAG: hypothetical protein Q8R92_09885 [Deltaproteobacteria bacterium]|nr:hypothetical protein [Deltaproteobacteria bacterium]
MPREPLMTTGRPPSNLAAEPPPQAGFRPPGAGAAPRIRKTGVVRRVADELYDLVDLRTRERYEYRRLPL